MCELQLSDEGQHWRLPTLPCPPRAAPGPLPQVSCCLAVVGAYRYLPQPQTTITSASWVGPSFPYMKTQPL